jgi:hypothetical protein
LMSCCNRDWYACSASAFNAACFLFFLGGMIRCTVSRLPWTGVLYRRWTLFRRWAVCRVDTASGHWYGCCRIPLPPLISLRRYLVPWPWYTVVEWYAAVALFCRWTIYRRWCCYRSLILLPPLMPLPLPNNWLWCSDRLLVLLLRSCVVWCCFLSSADPLCFVLSSLVLNGLPS